MLPRPAPNLSTLPFELLRLIVSHIQHAQSLSSLSQTCKSLHHFVTTYGWSLFVRECFSVQAQQLKSRAKSRQIHKDHSDADIDWAQTADHLTALSRNWENWDFKLRFLNPPLGMSRDERYTYLSTVDPVLDCWEELGCWTGGLRDDRLVVGVRNVIIVRRRKEVAKGLEPLIDWSVYPKVEPALDLDGGIVHPEIGYLKILGVDERFGGEGYDDNDDDEGFNGERVFVYKKLATLETVELREASHEVFYADREEVKIQVDEKEENTVRGYKQLFRYDTDNKVPYGADASPGHNVVAAALRSRGKQELVIYPLYAQGQGYLSPIDTSITRKEKAGRQRNEAVSIPISSRTDVPLQESSVARQLKFISNDRFVTVNSYTHNPTGPALSVWQITPTEGLGKAPTWELYNPEAAGSSADIEPFCAVKLPDGCHSVDRKAESSGNLFLSGWNDGKVHLYDLRQPPATPPAQSFTDRMHPWKTITSIATLGHDRFAASVAKTSLIKIYDLRMPGSKVYTYSSRSSRIHSSTDLTLSHTVWATNLSKDTYTSSSNPQLCTGSSFGKSLYAGLLGQVAELDFWNKTPETEAIELSGYTFNQETGIIRKMDYKCRRDSNISGWAAGWHSNFCTFVY